MPNSPVELRQGAGKAPRNRRVDARAGAQGGVLHDDARDDDFATTAILPFLTVAIGASAGGLHAFTTFLNNLPPDTGMAFVLIQHLDPIHKSLLVNLLAPHTAMPVVEAGDRMPLAPHM